MATSTPATRKTLELSPKAHAVLLACLPLSTNAVGQILVGGTGTHFASIFSPDDYHADAEIASFIAALVNEALTPAPSPAPEPPLPSDTGMIWSAAEMIEREG